jgi:hypothetical protein
LTFVDLILGVTAAIMQKHNITSKTMSRTISKILVYELCAVLTYLIQVYLIPEFPISKLVLAWIALTESKSIFENLYRITKIDLVKKIIDMIQIKQDKDMTTGFNKPASQNKPSNIDSK